MRLCIISPERVPDKAVVAALSSVDQSITSIMCLQENCTSNACKTWIKSQKNRNITLEVCEPPNWQKYGRRAIFIRESFLINNNDMILIIWYGNNDMIKSFITRCAREGINIHEIIIKNGLSYRTQSLRDDTQSLVNVGKSEKHSTFKNVLF
jgi:hypothetical protein